MEVEGQEAPKEAFHAGIEEATATNSVTISDEASSSTVVESPWVRLQYVCFH